MTRDDALTRIFRAWPPFNEDLRIKNIADVDACIHYCPYHYLMGMGRKQKGFERWQKGVRACPECQVRYIKRMFNEERESSNSCPFVDY